MRYYYTRNVVDHPDGAVSFTIWSPPTELPDQMGDMQVYWGWVEYTSPLSYNQVLQYDLWPWDTMESVKFMAWKLLREDRASALEIFESYIDYLDDGPPATEEMWSDPHVQIIELLKEFGITNVMTFISEIEVKVHYE